MVGSEVEAGSPVSAGRRFSFGRSSSSPFDFLDGSVSSSIGAFEFGLRRSVGLFGSCARLIGTALIFEHGEAELHVVELRRCHDVLRPRLQNLLISFCDFWMRSSVGGCVENTFDMVPGFRFSMVWIFSKKSTKAVGS